MCGIIGCVSKRNVSEIIINGLKRLEYRGYDSAGLAVIPNGANKKSFHLKKTAGKISALEALINHNDFTGTIGIGHTRWATHGIPAENNAHPHFSCNKEIVVVHNGIIENFEELKEELLKQGHKFSSETDTEVIAHLLEKYLKKHSPQESLQRVVSILEGSFALGIIFLKEPQTLYGARCNSPLIIGAGDGENFIASDVPAILPYTHKVIYIDEGQVVRLTADKINIFGFDGRTHRALPKEIKWDIKDAEKGGYPHFMLKEIFEQPSAVESSISYYINSKGCGKFKCLSNLKEKLKKINRIVITACGTAWHAGLVAKYALEELCRLPVEVSIASEFRYGNPVLDKHTLFLAVSQSGETADTLAALREAKCAGALTMAICNVVGSSITREADTTVYTYAGPEISVASTKAYTCQISVLLLFAVYLARLRGSISGNTEKQLLKEIKTIPAKLKTVLKSSEAIRSFAHKYKNAPNFMYIARRYNFPNAYEGALKLKEISYTHAEGYGAGEMKHGPLALVDNTFPTVTIAVKGTVYEKMLSNIQEIKARRGIIIAVATEGDEHIRHMTDDIIYVPETQEMFSPLLTVLPLQLLAYHTAVAKGRNVDQPRNLAKSVTVE
ncbi:MAG: glutamine--fructose-6-phosphate transaminase (isomerizing) [Planctomycetes bacterium]|nr:glutamine--fructose-6-phosphate transaminase (isomerizing) [Planctomycetota bacterium]